MPVISLGIIYKMLGEKCDSLSENLDRFYFTKHKKNNWKEIDNSTSSPVRL